LLFYMCQLWALHVVIKRQFFYIYTKCEVSAITCYEDMKSNTKCRNCGGLA